MNIEKSILRTAMAFFILAGGLLSAYVYDVEPLSIEKHYQLEREVHARSSDSGFSDFPSYNEWVREQDAKSERINAYIEALKQKIGEDAADSFDWTRGRSSPDPEKPMSDEQWRAAYGN